MNAAAEPLKLIMLYGPGAVVIHDDKNEYRPVDGVLCVPPRLLARALGMGFSRTPPRTIEQADGDSCFLTSGDVRKQEAPFIPPVGLDC